MRAFVKFLILPIFFLLCLQVSSPVSAQQLDATTPRKFSNSTEDLKQRAADFRASMSALKRERKDALTDMKVKACQARQANISKRSDKMLKRATNQLDVFAKISQRVIDFYQTKLVPQGKIVANYDVLVSDINTKSAAVAPLLQTAQADAANFSCDKDRPADQLKQFEQDMKAVNSALKDYRLSVRNLIVAVKSIAGVENSATNSARPVTTQ